MPPGKVHQSAPRLLADRMLGKLVRYLRIAGFDTLFLESGKNPVDEARRSRRILLTRNRAVAGRCRTLGLACVLVLENYPHGQTGEVVSKLGARRHAKPFTRCVMCNIPLLDVKDKADVKGWVPPFVYRSRSAFRRCPGCGRIFWNATHKRSMQRLLASVFGEKE
jgi:uncharacterized protein with PIN domain